MIDTLVLVLFHLITFWWIFWSHTKNEGGESFSITSLRLNFLRKGQSMGILLLKTLSKCGRNTEAFYASVVVSLPLVRLIRMPVDEA